MFKKLLFVLPVLALACILGVWMLRSEGPALSAGKPTEGASASTTWATSAIAPTNAVSVAAKGAAACPLAKRDERKIKLQSRTIDVSGARAFPSEFSATQKPTARGTAPYVVACDAVPTKALRERIVALGARVIGYVPNNALLIETDAATLARLADELSLRAAVEFEATDKMAPDFRAQVKSASGKVDVTISTLADADVATAKKLVFAAGGELVSGAGFDHDFFTVSIAAEKLEGLLAAAEIRWIEPWQRPQSVNNRITAEKTTNADAVRGATNTRLVEGLTGAGQRVMVFDSGLDTGNTNTVHNDLRDRQYGDVLVYGKSEVGKSVPQDLYGHGTHVAGTICGTGADSSGSFKGVAYGAMMRMMSYNGGKNGGAVWFNDEDMTFSDVFCKYYSEDRYRIHSNSWGGFPNNAYNAECVAIDTVAWSNKNLSIVFAAGNAGPENHTLNVQPSSKNVLTVGSTRNYHSNKIGTMDKEDTVFCCTLSKFSSRGPTRDGRIKPDICAPGESLVSTRSLRGTFDPYEKNSKYTVLNGTSMATPTVSGNAALLREWLVRDEHVADPSAALVKAMLCGGAVDMYAEMQQYAYDDFKGNNADCASAAVPAMDQGWGRLNLADTIKPLNGQQIFYADELPFSQNATFSFTFTTTAAGPLSVQLAWIDYPGVQAAVSLLVNDLDLTVTREGEATIWHGNGGTGDDEINNNESVRIANAPVGTYTVKVGCPRVVYSYLEGGAAALYVRGAFDSAAVTRTEGSEVRSFGKTTLLVAGEPADYEDDQKLICYGITNVNCRESCVIYPIQGGMETPEGNIRRGVDGYKIYMRARGSSEAWVERADSTRRASFTDPIEFFPESDKEYKLVYHWSDQYLVTLVSETPGLRIRVGSTSEYAAESSVSAWLRGDLGSNWCSVDAASYPKSTFVWSGLNPSVCSNVVFTTKSASAYCPSVRFIPLAPFTLYVRQVPPPEGDNPLVGTFSVVGDPANYEQDGLPLYMTDAPATNGASRKLYVPKTAADVGGQRYLPYGSTYEVKQGDGTWTAGAYAALQSADMPSQPAIKIADNRNITFNMGAADTRLVWHWTNAVNVAVSVSGGVSCQINQEIAFSGDSSRWFAVGQRVRLSLEEGYLCTWSGLPADAVKTRSNPDTYEFIATEDVTVVISSERASCVNVTTTDGSYAANDESGIAANGCPWYGNHYILDNTVTNFYAPAEPFSVPYHTENLRFRCNGFYTNDNGYVTRTGKRPDVLIPTNCYTHVQGEYCEDTLYLLWEWMVEGRVRFYAGDVNTKVSLNGENFSNEAIGWYSLGEASTVYLADPGVEVTLYGGTNTESTYEWTGLPDVGVTFDDNEHKRVARFTPHYSDFQTTNCVANIFCREIPVVEPDPPTPPPGPTPEEQEYPFADKDTISILTLGNSYSHYAVAGQTSCLGMIEALGKKGRLALAFQPYGSFSDHWNNHTKPRYCDLNIAVSAGAAPLNVDPATWTIDGALENENWDIVMLHSSTDEMWYPWTDSWRTAEQSAYDNLVALIHEKCPKAKIYLLQFWPVGIFCDKLNPRKTIQEFDAIPVRDAQYENYVRNYDWAFHRFDDDPNLAGLVQKIIPAGYAQILYSYRRPIMTFRETVQLMSGADKNFHPSNGGYVVQSLTWVRAIFGQLPAKGDLPQKYKDILAEYGADLDTAYDCVEDACKAAHSRYFTYRENVDFRYNVTIKNYDGTPIGEVQSVTNRGCATLPDPATIDVGAGYEFVGWRTHMNNPYANDYKTYTDEEMRAFKVFDTLDVIVKRRHVGEVEPERVWTGLGADNSWNTKENWEPEVVPDAKSDVFIPFPADATNTVTVSVPSAIAINSLTVGSGTGLGRAVLSFNINDFSATNTVATTVTVNSNGFITCLYSCQGLSGAYMSRVSSLNYRVTLKSGGNFIINKGGAVDVVSKGFPRGNMVTGLDPASTVPGACGYTYTTGVQTWHGGSHGGISGQCKTAPACASTDLYPCYGSIRHPLTLGSSGAVSWGGGGIHLIAAGDMLIDGEIRANGEDGRYKLLSPDYGSVLYGSGAGGSVWLEAHAFTGTGTVDVRGGINTENANRSRACGGSGRIAIYTQEVFDHAFSVAHEGDVINLLAGPRKCKNETVETDNYHGGGTIYIETSTHEPGHGVLYIDGGNVGTAGREYATQIGSLVEESGDEDAYFASVVLQNRGRLYLTPGSKLYTRELTIRGDDPLTTCTDSAYDSTLGTVEIVGAHHFGAWVTNTFANCTNAGECVRTCADDGCGLAETNVIAALGHDWGEWVTNPAPTKVSTGLRTRTCQRSGCGEKEAEVLPKLEMCTLTLEATTHGTISGATAGDYMTNTVISLTATADAGYRFAGWTGAASGKTNPLVLTMDSDKTIGATFEEGGKPPAGPYPIDPADGWSVSKDGYTVTVYTNVVGTHTYTVPEGVFAIDYLIVGGGGAGANSSNNGGGGGAGGVMTNTVAFSVTPGSSLTVTVGKGGVHGGSNNTDCGGNSSLGDLIAYGGGAGLGNKASGKSGGSGGGAGGGGSVSSDVVGGAGTDLQGHAGGTVKAGGSNRGGAGGGGAGAKGDDCSSSNANPSNGGAGIVCCITGEPIAYAAGGGGGGSGVTSVEKQSHGGSAGGVEIGGKGGGNYLAGGKGVDGTGSGGGGTGYTAHSSPGGDGGDGIVIIRYATETPPTPTHTHNWSAWTTNVYPTCTTVGNETRSCIAAGCEEPPMSENHELAALGHDWSEWVTNPAPTKISTGLRTRVCQRKDCDAKEEEVVPKLPDDPDPPTPPPGPGPGPGGDPTPYPIAAGDGWSKVVDNAVVVAFTNVNNKSLSFTVPKGVTAIDYLIVGGGGGGGNAHNGGGGGAGGVLTNVISMAVTAGTDISVVVGKGGDRSASGKNSEFGGLVAYGGGAGASASKAAGVGGGSGGGAAGGLTVNSDIVGGSATNGQGHVGGTVTVATRRCGAGGGGAGGPGANATTGNGDIPSGFGGSGIVSAITGEATGYGAGGGGGGSRFAVDSRATGGAANGVVIGGSGGTGSQSATDGINGTGSGGGGAGYADITRFAGKGGDGIVIIRYATKPRGALLIIF